MGLDKVFLLDQFVIPVINPETQVSSDKIIGIVPDKGCTDKQEDDNTNVKRLVGHCSNSA